MNDIITRLIDLPLCVKGFTEVDGNGDYNIYLNSRYCFSQIQRTYKHEMNHIINKDFDKLIPAHIIERNAPRF